MKDEEKKVPQKGKGGFGKQADKNDSSEEEEGFDEPAEQRTVPQFLLGIPGVTASDSMGYRIEALRVYLENQLGDIPFLAAYKHLVVS